MKSPFIEDKLVGQFRAASEYSLPMMLTLITACSSFVAVMGWYAWTVWQMWSNAGQNAGWIGPSMLLAYYGIFGFVALCVLVGCFGGLWIKYGPKRKNKGQKRVQVVLTAAPEPLVIKVPAA